MGFCGFVYGFPTFGLDLVGVWGVGFRSGGCDFFQWVGGFVSMGLMVVFSVCLVVGFDEDNDDDE